jgi:uncharacterized lipoprotein YehR (DUF1307 family)
MKQILIAIILLFSFSGCQDKKEDQAQHDAKIAQEARAQLLKEQEEAKKKQEEVEKNSKFSKIGITSKDGKIIIDTNKTKSYFKDLAHEMKSKIFVKEFDNIAKEFDNQNNTTKDINATN